MKLVETAPRPLLSFRAVLSGPMRIRARWVSLPRTQQNPPFASERIAAVDWPRPLQQHSYSDFGGRRCWPCLRCHWRCCCCRCRWRQLRARRRRALQRTRASELAMATRNGQSRARSRGARCSERQRRPAKRICCFEESPRPAAGKQRRTRRGEAHSVARSALAGRLRIVALTSSGAAAAANHCLLCATAAHSRRATLCDGRRRRRR